MSLEERGVVEDKGKAEESAGFGGGTCISGREGGQLLWARRHWKGSTRTNVSSDLTGLRSPSETRYLDPVAKPLSPKA